ncbi:MAG: FAD-dependent monooxygenase [Myxococcales bacterium]
MAQDVIVVGGGFAGLSAAAAFANLGAKVRVFEASDGQRPGPFRGELIHPRGVRGLAALGLHEPLLAAGGVPVLGFAVTPEAGEDLVALPYDSALGTGLGIDHFTMVQTLRREVAARGVEIITGQRIEELLVFGERVVGLRRADRTEHRADLVVVADGRHSKLRLKLGMAPESRLLSTMVALGVRGVPLPEPGHGHVFLGAPGPILAYPYGEDLVRICVDVPVGPKGKDALIAAIREQFAHHLPLPLRRGLLEALESGPFEGCAVHAMSTAACAAPGVALVGDAAGCAHPLTASGLTNAVSDVLTLAEEIGRAGPTPRALEAYQRRRYDFIRMRELFTEALYEVFRGSEPGPKALQRGVFQYWRGSERARAVSMAILAGEELNPARFAAEYSRVFGLSALEVLGRMATEPVGGARRLRSLVQTSYGRIEAAATQTARAVVDRYRLKLVPARPVAAHSRESAQHLAG